MKIYVTNGQGELTQVDGKSVVLELESGKTIELSHERYRADAPESITLWGGRQPQASWKEDETVRQSEQLNLSLIAGNCIDVWPGRAKKQ